MELASMLLTSLVSGCCLFAIAKGALTNVSYFGSNPAGIQMWIEVPSNLKTNAPIIVAVSLK